ncbi:unnamed protein product [Sphacelaria rigidula]
MTYETATNHSSKGPKLLRSEILPNSAPFIHPPLSGVPVLTTYSRTHVHYAKHIMRRPASPLLSAFPHRHSAPRTQPAFGWICSLGPPRSNPYTVAWSIGNSQYPIQESMDDGFDLERF